MTISPQRLIRSTYIVHIALCGRLCDSTTFLLGIELSKLWISVDINVLCYALKCGDWFVLF